MRTYVRERKTNVYLATELMSALRNYAKERNVTLKLVIEEAIELYLREAKRWA